MNKSYWLITVQQNSYMSTQAISVNDVIFESSTLQKYLRESLEMTGVFNIIFLKELTKEQHDTYLSL